MKPLYLALLLFCANVFAADTECETRFFFGGMPKVTLLATNDHITLLTNCGYVVGYSEARRNPIWVAYHLRKVGPIGEQAANPKRKDNFRVDNRTTARVTKKDFDWTHTGLDRGHMAPSYGIGSRFGENAQDETFFMSNMCPQLHEFNDGTWGNLEECEADTLANAFQEVWIIDGPIFTSSSRTLTSGVPVPAQFYKIIIDEENGNPRVFGFVMDHGAARTKSFDQFLMNVKAIETRAGVDFFPELPSDERSKLEKSKPRKIWKLPAS